MSNLRLGFEILSSPQTVWLSPSCMTHLINIPATCVHWCYTMCHSCTKMIFLVTYCTAWNKRSLRPLLLAWHDSWELSALHELALSLYLWALSQIIVYRPLYCCQWSCYKKCHIICNWQANWALLIPYEFSLEVNTRAATLPTWV